LPIGRAKLATRPVPTGSFTVATTIGMTAVARFAARADAVPCVTMTSTWSRTNSVAISTKRSVRPSAQRYSITILRFSIQPSWCSRCTKAGNTLALSRRRGRAEEPDSRQLARLLRTRGERPRRNRAAGKYNEFPSPHGFARAEDYIGY
jgi:hypothetical protein